MGIHRRTVRAVFKPNRFRGRGEMGGLLRKTVVSRKKSSNMSFSGFFGIQISILQTKRHFNKKNRVGIKRRGGRNKKIDVKIEYYVVIGVFRCTDSDYIIYMTIY